MPVEIMEMVVRATVDENRSPKASQQETQKKDTVPCTSENISDQVTDLMRRKKER